MDEQRKRRKRRSRKAMLRRRRRIMLTQLAVLVVIVAVALALIVKGVRTHKAEKAAAASATEQTADTKSDNASEKVVVVNNNNGQKETEEKEEAKKEAVDKRAEEFAVQPGVPCGGDGGEGKIVYLTFDDGPSQNTAEILEILDAHNAKATFFITGNQPDYRYLIKEAYSRGHTIALHTFSHDYSDVYASVDDYFADLEAVGAVAAEQIGYVPCFIRFPGGSSNTVSRKYTDGIMSELVDLVQERGYQYYDWNASSGDGGTPTTEETYEYSTSYDGMDKIMLLMHDAPAKVNTVEALTGVIEYYQELGYEFKAIDRNSIAPHHGVNN